MLNPGVTPDKDFGEMYIVDSVASITVNAADEWHAVDTPLEGAQDGFTYELGSTGVIASVADAGGGDVTIGDAGHGLSAGDIITINGCTDAAYNGFFEVKTAATDTFTITAVYTATDTGMRQKGSNLTVTVAGIYSGKWNATGISAVNTHIFDFSPAVNTTLSTKAKSRRKFSNADYGAFGGTGLMQFAVGDKITFNLQNVGASGDMTIRTLNLNISRL